MSFDLKLDNGDLRISNTGDITTIRDNEKLLQDAMKILITPVIFLEPLYSKVR